MVAAIFFLFTLSSARKDWWSFKKNSGSSSSSDYASYIPISTSSSEDFPDCAVGFSYDDTESNGPAHWGSICAEWAACDGLQQSPINIITGLTTPKTTQLFEEHYLNEFNGTLTNIGYTYTLDVTSLSNTISGGPLNDDYELLQFHFHTPSEHTIDGQYLDLELHLVHVPLHDNATTYRAVVALFFTLSETSDSVLTEFLNGITSLQDDNETSINWNVHLHDLLFPVVKENAFYHYNGSLTSPPCTEHVAWFLMAKPLAITASQLDFFSHLVGHNSRPVQPMNQRQVEYYVVPMDPQSVTSYSLWVGGSLLILVLCVLAYYLFKNCQRDYLKLRGYSVHDSEAESFNSENGWFAMEKGLFPDYSMKDQGLPQYTTREYDYN